MLLTTGCLDSNLGVTPMDPAQDRCMMCGSPAMLADTRAVLDE